MTYAIAWLEDTMTRYAGRLELTARSIELAGTGTGNRQGRRTILYDDLENARIERDGQAGGGSRPALVLRQKDGSRFTITSLAGPGALHELTERVAAQLSALPVRS